MRKGFYIAFVATIMFASDTSASWVKRADFGSHGRHRGTAFSVANKGYMGLGHYNGAGPNIVLNDWWEYDPATNSWTQKADYIGNNGNGNYGVLAFSTDDYGYIGGGQQGGDNRLYRYDPSTNIWTPMANTPTTPMNTEGFVVGDKGYYMSGSSLFEYDFANDTWSTKNPAPFSTTTWNTGFGIGEKGYIKAGSSLWEYKPSIDAWTHRAYFPGFATGASVALVHDTKAYVVCGYGTWLSDVYREVWEYDPFQNEWTQLGDFPGTARRFSSGLTIGERAFFGIGTNGTNFNDFWEFDPWASVDKLFDQSTLSVSPNPATDVINFKLDGVSSFELDIFDMTGKTIHSASTTTGEIQFLKGLNTKGTYLYHLKIDGAIVHTDKFIFN